MADLRSDHQTCMLCVINAMRIMTLIDLPAAIANAEHSDAVAPFIDPTLWMKKHRHLKEDLELMRAALPLWREAAKFPHPQPTD